LKVLKNVLVINHLMYENILFLMRNVGHLQDFVDCWEIFPETLLAYFSIQEEDELLRVD